MKKSIMFILGFLVLFGVLSPIANASYGSFSVRMIEQAPSNVQKYNDTAYFSSNRQEAVTFDVSSFRSDYTGGYAAASARQNTNSRYKTNQINIQSLGAHRAYYAGDGLPRGGSKMTATIQLRNYSGRQVVIVEGRVGE